MEQELIRLLDEDLECTSCHWKKDSIVMEVRSIKNQIRCPYPYCGRPSTKVHSAYQREIQDIPFLDKQMILLFTRKMFCKNPGCEHKTFDFVAPNGKKTKRLVKRILITSIKMSSVSASYLLKTEAVQAGKSRICDLLKKMPEIADKSFVKKVCVDDFAFRKRYTYGTVMVDLDSHRIIDIIDSRETKQVENWLLAYPNLEVISRDGAQAYASAASRSHPEALQVSDRFHLLKNLSDSIEKYLYRLLPSRLSIPTGSPECQALYDTRNRGERIRFAQKKRSEGTTVNDIALLLHSSTSTILKYLAIPKDQIPESRENARERQYIRSMKNKQDKMEGVRTLYIQGHAIDEITRLTGHTSLMVKNYLKEDYPVTNGNYDQRRPGKLTPYEKVVIQMRSQGITYREIHECICRQGYTGTIASLRVFMQKERTHQKSISKNRSAAVEYIPRKCLCQLLYHKLEDVKGMTQDQYEEALKKYPIFGQVYSLLKEFHRIVFSKHDEELDTWINSAEKLQIEELNPYINGLKNDISAVKNSIKYPYNNGLAEGSVNKIKLIKRVMYGRNSFLLLKAKLLLNEFYYQIN